MPDPPPPLQPHTRPRWVMLLGIVVLVLVLVAVVVMLASGGRHGPGRHQGRGHLLAGQTLSIGDRPVAGFDHAL